MKFTYIILTLFFLNCSIKIVQGNIGVTYISANVQGEKIIYGDNLNSLLGHVKTDKNKVQVMVIAIQETKGDDIADAKIAIEKFSGPTKKIECDALKISKLNTLICIQQNKNEKFGKIINYKTEKNILKQDINANINTARGKGFLGACYADLSQTNEKQIGVHKGSCYCFLNNHLEVDPKKSFKLMNKALQEAYELCEQPTVYSAGDYNLRTLAGNQEVQLISMDEYKQILDVIKAQETENIKQDDASLMKFKEGDTKASQLFINEFEKSKDASIKALKLSFKDNDKLQNEKMTYKYRAGPSMINEYSDFKEEKGKLEYKGPSKLKGLSDHAKYKLNGGMTTKLLQKKDCYGKYCMSLGWLDKLGCFSSQSDCHIKNAVKFQIVDQLKQGDHLPIKIEFEIDIPEQKSRIMNFRKQKILQN